jgi:hypothetical protein
MLAASSAEALSVDTSAEVVSFAYPQRQVAITDWQWPSFDGALTSAE